MEKQECYRKHTTPAIVLGMTATGLSIARSLGRKGIPVYGIDSSLEAGMYSRYCQAKVSPRVQDEEEEFLEFLLQLSKPGNEKPILYVAADEYMSCISKHRKTVSEYFTFNIPESWIVDSFLDKNESYRLAEKHKIPYPHSFSISSEDDIRTYSQQLAFPCILKPVRSHLWRKKYGALKVFVVHSLDEALLAYRETKSADLAMVLQEIIVGADSDIYCVIAYYNRQGALVASFCKRKQRQYPIHFGISSFCVGEDNEEVRQKAIALFDKIGYTGLGGVEFKRDSRDGKLKFIELNLRTLMTGDLTVHSGVDFPFIYYQDLCGQKIAPPCYQNGVKLTNIFLDISSFWHYRSLKEITFWQWIKTYQGKVYDTYFAWDDVKPFWYSVSRFLKSIPHKITLLVNKKDPSEKSIIFVRKPLTIFHLISSEGVYGSAKVLLTLGKGLAQRGHHVIVGNMVTPGGQSNAVLKEAETAGLQAQEFVCQGRLDRATLAKLKDFIRKQHIDIVHTHGYKTNYYASDVKQNNQVKLVATCHNWTSNTLKMKLYEMVDYYTLKKFDRVVAVSTEIFEKLRQHGMKEPLLKLIYNGIDTSAGVSAASFGLRKKYGLDEKTLCFGTIGRLSPEKGQAYLIEAFAHLAKERGDSRLFIVGEGPDRLKLERDVQKRGLAKQVIFTGYQPQAQTMLADFDVFVLPSLKEGVPMVLLEAMMAGKVIVATAVGEIPAIIGEGGIICPPRDARALADALKNALHLSPSETASLGQMGRFRVLEEFSSTKMVVAYEKLYGKLF